MFLYSCPKLSTCRVLFLGYSPKLLGCTATEMGAHGKVLSPQHSLFPLPLITSLLCHYCSLSAQAYNPDIYNFLDSPLALPAFRTIGGKHIHKNSSAKAQNRHNHVPWFAPRIASLQSLGGVHKYNKALCPWPLIITHLPFSPNLL